MSASQVYSAEAGVLDPALAPTKAVFVGALWGVAMWSAYALVEFFLYEAMPVLTGGAVLTPDGWHVNALVLDCYWILGALGGGLCGAVVNRWSARSIAGMQRRLDLTRLPATLSLLLGLLINFISAIPLRPGRPLLAAVLGLGSATVWVMARPKSRLAGWLKINPIVFALLLLGPTWLSGEFEDSPSLTLKGLAMLLMVAALLGIQAWLRRWSDWSGKRHLIAYLVLITALTGATDLMSGANKRRATAVLPAMSDPKSAPVVMVSLDTTRADHLSVYGYTRKTTPNLAEFAKSATLYAGAMAVSDYTLPSHASMFTGVYPSWHGAHIHDSQQQIPNPLDRTLPTLADILASRGYYTAGAAANSAFLSSEWGLQRGFQTFDQHRTPQAQGLNLRFNMRYGIRRLLDCCIDTMEFDATYVGSEDVNAAAFSMMNSRAAARSSFLFVNYMDAHSPYVSPAPYNHLFLGLDRPVDFPMQKAAEGELFRKGTPVPRDIRDRLIAQYDAGIAYQDVSFGSLIAWLKQRGQYDQSLIIVTGDHGEAFGERNLIGHGMGLYEDQVHVPLLIKYPNQKSASVVTAPVSHVDLLPTVLDTIGYPIPPYVQGRSLRDGAGLEGRLVFAESFPNPRPALKGRMDRIERAVRSGSMKLIVSTNGKHELYDVENDPHELHAVRAQDHAGAEALEVAMREWIRNAPAGVANRVMTKRQFDNLKGLGYIR